MKILTMIYRGFTCRCIYCGNKKRWYDLWGDLFCCPTDMAHPQSNGCSRVKKFMGHKESKIQIALGLFSGPKGYR